MWFLAQRVQGQVFLGAYSPFLPQQKVSQARWTQTVVTPNTFITRRAHKQIIFPSEGQCGHLEAENNSEQQRVSMQVVTPWPVQRRALRSNQANTQLHTLQFLNFCFTLLHVSSFHHLQDFQAYICSYNTSSGPSLSPTSLISGASIYFVNSKPETA